MRFLDAYMRSNLWILSRERELNNGLQAHYSAEAKTKSEWEVGELCVVELKEKFCRGTVQEVQDGQCKIFFIDKVGEPFSKINCGKCGLFTDCRGDCTFW